MQSALGKLITFPNNNPALIKNCCYGSGRFTTCPPFGYHLQFFKNYILRKTEAYFTEILRSRKYVFAASNRDMIKNRV